MDPNTTHFNKRCTSISKSSTRSTVHFSDGSTYEADVIIGADGIKSAVRGSVVAGKHLAFTNTVAYRGLVSAQTLKDAGFKTNASVRPINFVGNDKVCYRCTSKMFVVTQSIIAHHCLSNAIWSNCN